MCPPGNNGWQGSSIKQNIFIKCWRNDDCCVYEMVSARVETGATGGSATPGSLGQGFPRIGG
jgi:hypothetical protein